MHSTSSVWTWTPARFRAFGLRANWTCRLPVLERFSNRNPSYTKEQCARSSGNVLISINVDRPVCRSGRDVQLCSDDVLLLGDVLAHEVLREEEGI